MLSGTNRKRSHSPDEDSGKKKMRRSDRASGASTSGASNSGATGGGANSQIDILKALKEDVNSGKASPTEFFNSVNSLKKEFREEAYRTISSESEKGRELLENMKPGQLQAWAESLGSVGRALESESLSKLLSKLLGDARLTRPRNKDSKDSTSNLQEAAHVLQRVIGDKDQGPKGGGVGSPGFTKENTEKAGEIGAEAAHEYIADKILGSEGEDLRVKIRKDPSDANKEKAGNMIRKIKYSEALPNEMHAIGLGNDVLAASWVEGIRYASPYQQIAREIDDIITGNFHAEPEIVPKIIAKYAGLTITNGVRALTKEENQKFGAKLREFATIQIAEKGREIKRAKEAGDIADKKLVEEALKNAVKEGFDNVYVRNTREKAPFAAEGGQQRLREIYGYVGATR